MLSNMSQYVYGRNTVKLLLSEHPKRVFKVFVAEGLKADKRIDAIYELAGRHGTPIQRVPRIKLDQMMQSGATSGEGPVIHQGVVASVSPKQLLSLHELIKKAKERPEGQPRLVMLDGVTDPRNFGAILRVCDAAGVDGVLVTKHKSAGFGPAVAKTASGAEETVDITMVANLANSLKTLKDEGFWIVGATGGEDSSPYYRQDFDMPVVLILGSEGEGLSHLIGKLCDFKVRIPMRGAVESLNVATAAAVLLFEMARPKG